MLSDKWPGSRTCSCYLKPAIVSTLIVDTVTSPKLSHLKGDHYENQRQFSITQDAPCASQPSTASPTLSIRRNMTVEHVHLGTNKSRVKEAEAAGVKSVPALVMNGAAFHINFGAGIDALK